MNYFAHGHRFLNDPYFLSGTAVPDWLSVVDRPTRVRARHAQPHLADDDARTAALAAGIARHHYDDAWFHETTAFVELSVEFAQRIRLLAPDDISFRPSFVGHILVEVLLDAALTVEEPARLHAYYDALAEVDPELVQSMVNRMASRQANHLAAFIRRFREVRFLFDYLDDVKLAYRLNQVMVRVGLPALPESLSTVLPFARACVAARREELLAEPAVAQGGKTAV